MRLQLVLIYFLLLALSENSIGQTTTSSPYSLFGIGQVDMNGSGKSCLIGGTGIGLKSDGYLNNINPASYGGIDSLSFIFEVGTQSSISYYHSYDIKQRNTTTNFNYLAMGFQLTKWCKSSIGTKPYSHVGYNITVENPIEGSSDTYFTNFIGNGDISQIYFGNSVSFIDNLSIGLNFSYLFGPIKHEEHVYLPFNDDEQIIVNKKHISGFYLDYGLQYTIPKKKWDYTIGAIYAPKKNLKSTNTLIIQDADDNVSTETIEEEESYSIPQKFGLGFSMVNKDKTIYLSTDYRFEEWSTIDLSSVTADYINSNRFSLGLEYLPSTKRRDSYYKKVHYMLGAYYAGLSLKYKGIPLIEKGFTLGFGLPINNNKSLINLGFEIGERGSLENGLIKENYYNLNLSFTLKDTWFKKQRYR